MSKNRTLSYPASSRLKKRSSFLQVKEEGVSQASKHFVASFLKRANEPMRLGVSVTKKVEPLSVRRNRVKRLIREFFRISRPHFILGGDLVIIARRGVYGLSFKEVENELRKLLARLRVL